MTGRELDWMDAQEHDAELDTQPANEPNTRLIETEPDEPERERGGIAA